MTDSEIQQIANQLAAINRQMIIDEIDRRWRTPSGVVSGGPYGSFSVNDQGHVIDAGAGGSVPFLFRYDLTGGLTITSGSETRLNFNSIEQDDSSLVTTGSSWHFTVPSDGWYAPTLDFRWSPGATLAAGANYRINLYRNTILIDEIFRWTAEMATPSGTLQHMILRIPYFYQSGWLINYRIDNHLSQSFVIGSTPFITMERIGDPSP